MKKEEFRDRMKACWTDDPESSHCEADALLVQALQDLGYDEGLSIYEQMPKWYA